MILLPPSFIARFLTALSAIYLGWSRKVCSGFRYRIVWSISAVRVIDATVDSVREAMVALSRFGLGSTASCSLFIRGIAACHMRTAYWHSEILCLRVSI